MNSSEIMKSSLLSVFESEEIEAWTDPYNSIPLKLLTIIIYLIELWASTVMLIFVFYETNGLFGHYRTVINQLLSYGYGAVSKIITKIEFTIRYRRQITALIGQTSLSGVRRGFMPPQLKTKLPSFLSKHIGLYALSRPRSNLDTIY